MSSLQASLCMSVLLTFSALTTLGCEADGESDPQEELDTLSEVDASEEEGDASEEEGDAGEQEIEDSGVEDLGPCSDEECGPTIGAPNYTCDDGVTVAGPGPCERQDNGQCGWTMVECPESPACDEENCQSVPDSCEGTWLQPGWEQSCDPESGECIASTAEL